MNYEKIAIDGDHHVRSLPGQIRRRDWRVHGGRKRASRSDWKPSRRVKDDLDALAICGSCCVPDINEMIVSNRDRTRKMHSERTNDGLKKCNDIDIACVCEMENGTVVDVESDVVQRRKLERIGDVDAVNTL